MCGCSSYGPFGCKEAKLVQVPQERCILIARILCSPRSKTKESVCTRGEGPNSWLHPPSLHPGHGFPSSAHCGPFLCFHDAASSVHQLADGCPYFQFTGPVHHQPLAISCPISSSQDSLFIFYFRFLSFSSSCVCVYACGRLREWMCVCMHVRMCVCINQQSTLGVYSSGDIHSGL